MHTDMHHRPHTCKQDAKCCSSHKQTPGAVGPGPQRRHAIGCCCTAAPVQRRRPCRVACTQHAAAASRRPLPATPRAAAACSVRSGRPCWSVFEARLPDRGTQPVPALACGVCKSSSSTSSSTVCGCAIFQALAAGCWTAAAAHTAAAMLGGPQAHHAGRRAAPTA